MALLQAWCEEPPTSPPSQEGKGKQRMEGFADRLSCAVFGLANTVTIMFYTVESATKVGGGNPCWRIHFAARRRGLEGRPAGLTT